MNIEILQTVIVSAVVGQAILAFSLCVHGMYCAIKSYKNNQPMKAKLPPEKYRDDLK